MIEIVILRGLPGSGKSTYAKEWKRKDFKNRVIINNDSLAESMGLTFNKQSHAILRSTREIILKEAIKNNLSVIIDNTNLLIRGVSELITLATETGKAYDKLVCFKEVFLHTPLKQYIENDKKRTPPVGEKVIRTMYNQYKELVVNE